MVRIVDDVPAECRWVRYWDMAATVPRRGTDPDWTVGAKVGLSKAGQWFVADVVRFRKAPFDAENMVAQTAALDGRGVAIAMEQEPGSSGVNMIDHYRRNVLVGYDFIGHRPTLSKFERARPFAVAAQAGNVFMLSGSWNRLALDELAGFPALPHDDQTDAMTGAVDVIMNARRARILA